MAATMQKVFVAYDSDGRAWVRRTRARNYTHAVVVYARGYQALNGRTVAPHAFSTWAGTAELAESLAKRYRNSISIERVEVLPAIEGR